MPDIRNLDFGAIVIALIVLAVVWGVIQRALKFTLQVFTCGCAVIGGLVLGVFVLLNWAEIAAALGLG